MKKEEMDRLFNPFHTVHSTVKPVDVSSTGLGLSIVKSIVEMMNGKVFVDHLSQLKQTRIKNKLAKLARQNV